MPRRRISEAKKRKELIDPQLEKAGWDVRDGTQVGIEIPVDGFDPDAWKKLEKQLRENGETPGVVEAQHILGGLLAEQKRFAVKVARHERLQSQQREAERQTEMLFQSLLIKNFKVA